MEMNRKQRLELNLQQETESNKSNKYEIRNKTSIARSSVSFVHATQISAVADVKLNIRQNK